MTTPLDAAAKALVAAEKYAADLVAERDALLTRVNELDDEVARLMGERDESRAELERVRDVVEASRSVSAAGVGGAPLAAVAMALEETGRLLAMGGHSPNTPHLFAQRARELREGK